MNTKPLTLIAKLALAIVTTVLMSGCMNGEYFLQKGKQSYHQREYRKAFIRLKEASEKNNADAQYALGYMYFYGQGVVENRQKAMYWFQRAAINGHQKAIDALNLLKNSSSEPYKPSPKYSLNNYPPQA